MTQPSNQQIAQLELQLKKLSKQVLELNTRVQYLERENTRRKNEVSQIASAVNKG